jgi:nucleotide-binding universal stress UspA family protein
MTFTKILCPTDFSAGSERALRVAARLANETGAELVIAHSWYIPATAYSIEAPFPAAVTREIIADAQRGLDTAVRVASDAGAPRVTSTLLHGVPWIELVGLLEQQPFDLCVIGTHGRTGLTRILIGSIAEKVIRHSPCATLAVRPDGEVKPFEHVLVPTDFSESAEHASELATKLVQPNGSITLLHVIELPVAYSGRVVNADFARDLDSRAAAALDRMVVKLRATGSFRINHVSRLGHAGAQTLAAIEDDATIDLVVMGSHGRTGIKRALLGSVAEKVVRHARRPVLVARNR